CYQFQEPFHQVIANGLISQHLQSPTASFHLYAAWRGNRYHTQFSFFCGIRPPLTRFPVNFPANLSLNLSRNSVRSFRPYLPTSWLTTTKFFSKVSGLLSRVQ